MSTFKFKNDVLKFKVNRVDDTLFKEYKISTGNEAFMLRIDAAAKKVEKQLKEIDNRDADSIENDIESNFETAKTSLRDFIDNALGAGEFDLIYKEFNENFIGMVMLFKQLYADINRTWKETTEGLKK